ncbi:putative flavin reductase family protein [Erysiphe necator]|uniref:Putative flavin reductase family protein n=1 Tax=Uncinula necator TaxID=52586 RepID=A0A0B1P1Q7_UNCNE|nr:putative flavin reductase family protein [Erysiphe necator]
MSNFGVNILTLITQRTYFLGSKRDAYNIIKQLNYRPVKLKKSQCFYSTPSNTKKYHNTDNLLNISPSECETINQPIIPDRSEIEQKLIMGFEEQVENIPDKVRQIMRYIPQSIAILTTCTIPKLDFYRSTTQVSGYIDDTSHSKGIGMTLSSVSTVTLQPEPIISFNIKKPSNTLEAIKYHGNFLIHFPSCSKAGAILADTFSRGGRYLQSDSHSRKEIRTSFERSTPISVINFDGQNINLPALLPPIYPINYMLKCEIYDRVNGYIDIADHVIVVAKVHKIRCISKSSSSYKSTSNIQERDSCLAYTNGTYCSTRSIFNTNDD